MDNDEISQRRTYLDTSDGLSEYAKGFGAIFDKKRREWYVVGEVPQDLLNLVPKQPREKAPPVVPPSCPLCRFPTKLREGRNGPFFGCTQFAKTDCKGTVDYDIYLENIGQPRPKSIGSILIPGTLQKAHIVPPASSVNCKLSPELQSAIKEIENLCVAEFSRKWEFDRWLKTPKVTLNGKTPLECMLTLEGCKRVKHLIQTHRD